MEAQTKPKMVIAGASGLIGRRLIEAAQGTWDITILTRRVDGTEPSAVHAVAWNPRAARDNGATALNELATLISTADVVVNLAGASIADGRFGAAHRSRILNSRVDATSTLVEALALANHPPRVWFQASATGLYGNRGEEVLTESSTPADDFLAQVGVAWEASVAPAATRTRLVIGRIGVVFAPEAKAWKQLLLPIRLFVGGPLGSGMQWWPWIRAHDLTRAILHLIGTPEGGTKAEGAYILTAPEPARQRDIARVVARHLHRPAVIPAPVFALRIILGGLADALLLPSTRAIPERLLQEGFEFTYPTLEEAVPALLAKNSN